MNQSSDAAISAIKALQERGRELSFEWLRTSFGVQESEATYRSLNYGRAIIETEGQLNQYLYSYGPMIGSQWEQAAQFLEDLSAGGITRWIDYGCGQGLAGLFIRERIGSDLFRDVREVILIEPSGPALRRAEAVYGHLCPKSTVRLVGKTFDELNESDFASKELAHTAHIFSNVLDIGGYDHLALLAKGLSPGRHTIVAVGHDRDYSGGSGYIEKLKAAVEHPSMASQIKLTTSHVERFACGNRGEPAIVWHCEMDVING